MLEETNTKHLKLQWIIVGIEKMTCPSTNVMLAHLNGEKDLSEFTREEIKMLPLEYLIKYAKPYDLLNIWTKLPLSYQGDFYLQISLPCFVHYNRPEWRTHFEGSAPSQRNCILCNKILLSKFDCVM